VCNEGRNVVGVMPHPERVSDQTLGSEEGLRILRSVMVGAGV
jgi:phosphoribosylformylglycinamidine synthase